MFITIVYQNGKYGAVEDSELDDLIKQKKVKKFLSSQGWCTVGEDPIRKEHRINYEGPERLRAFKKSAKVK